MDTMKIKLIHDRLHEHKYNGLFDGMSKILKKEGIRGMYVGLGPTLLKFSMNQGTRFMVYDKVTGALSRFGDPENSFHKNMKRVLAGWMAGGISVLMNQPVDVIKTNVQGLEAHKYNGSLDCFKKTMAAEGVRGLYKGIVPRFVRVCNTVAITFCLIENFKDMLWRRWPDYCN